MKWNNLFTGAILIMLTLLFVTCNKDEESPYTLYEGSLGRTGYCSVVNSEGNLYIVGSRASEILVLKTSLKGELIWEKTYNLFGTEVSSYGWTIEESYDNGFIISAYNSWDIYYNGLLKINASGDSVWSYILQDTGHVALQAVAEAADHSIIVVYEEETDIYEDKHQITVSKISPYGELISSKVHPDIFTREVWFNGWAADQDGNVILSTSQYNQAGSVWTVNSGLDIISQVPFQYGKEVAYFSETPGTFLCADEVYGHSQLLPLSKEVPGNDPLWERDFQMPCTGWADHLWIGPSPGGYIVLGVLRDEVKGYYYDIHPFCMKLDTAGNQNWLWNEKVDFNGIPYNFHFISENDYLIIGRDWDGNESIALWRVR